jgi:hypothetical protein
MTRFQAGSRYTERLRVVVTIDENNVGTNVVTVVVSVRKTSPSIRRKAVFSGTWFRESAG